MNRASRGYSAQSPEFSAWARFQDQELQERKGDGYSPWEYLLDLPGAAYNNANAYLTEAQGGHKALRTDGDSSATGSMRDLLNQMRGISDRSKANPQRQLTPEERDIQGRWEALRTKGIISY